MQPVRAPTRQSCAAVSGSLRPLGDSPASRRRSESFPRSPTSIHTIQQDTPSTRWARGPIGLTATKDDHERTVGSSPRLFPAPPRIVRFYPLQPPDPGYADCVAPHRDELEAAQQRIRALEDRVEELVAEQRPAPPEPPQERAVEPPKKESPKHRRSRGQNQAHAAQVAVNETRALVDQALSTHPTMKDALVTVLGGIVVLLVTGSVNLVIFFVLDEPRRIAREPALFDQGHIVALVMLAVAVISVALPRVLHPAPIFRIRSEDQMTYSPGIRLSRGRWAGITVAALVVNALVFVIAAR